MKYLKKESFSIFMGGNKQYDDNYNRIFRKRLRTKIREFIDKILFKLFIK